jgi:hypothetical protein|tara:strand:- start:7627 stop:7776 length:150 start_codon:yes stop_codon:yes gene_type:complete
MKPVTIALLIVAALAAYKAVEAAPKPAYIPGSYAPNQRAQYLRDQGIIK